MKIAFIGAGLMGRGMIARLVAAGHEVVVYARTPAKAVDLGVALAPSITAAAEGADVLCSCVTDSDDVAAVVEGLLAAASPPPILVELSTIAPAVARDLAAQCAARGVAYLDCPVSGGPEGAAAGTLAIMCGGDQAALATAGPVLDALGDPAKRVRVGPVGSGLVAKLVNNHMSAGIIATTAEALGIGQKAGVAPALLREIVLGATGTSWQLEHRFPAALAGNLAPGFTTTNLLKDLGHARDLVDGPLPLGDAVYDLYVGVDPGLDIAAVATRFLDLPTSEGAT